MCATKPFIVLVILWQCIIAQVDKKFFRDDYTYIEYTESFYKIHTINKNWHEAVKVCAAEGTHLFYPQDQKEAVVVTGFLRKTQPFNSVFLAASDILVKGVYQTIDGIPVQSLYHKWAKGEPNDGNTEDCVVLNRDGALQDESCTSEYPFICKKTLASLQWNEKCNMPDLDYEFNSEFKRCYKFHLDWKNWVDAYIACSAEQSYLVVLDSQAEADYILDLTKRAPKDGVPGDYTRGVVMIGMHNRTGLGWMTIKGVPLAESGFSQWAYLEPNNANEDGGEPCGSIYYGGGLNDISCRSRGFFICEHEL